MRHRRSRSSGGTRRGVGEFRRTVSSRNSSDWYRKFKQYDDEYGCKPRPPFARPFGALVETEDSDAIDPDPSRLYGVVPDAAALVFDIGSESSLIGFAGEMYPRYSHPSIVGRPKSPGIMVGMDQQYWWVGAEASARRGILKLKYPVEFGKIVNYNDFEKILLKSCNHLLDFEAEWAKGNAQAMYSDPFPPVMLIQKFGESTATDLVKKMELLFDTIAVPATQFVVEDQMALFASGLETGTIMHCGSSDTHSLCIENGRVLNRSYRQSNTDWFGIGGRAITQYLVQILCERGYEMTTTAERVIVEDIKRKLCFLSLDYATDLDKDENFGTYEVEYVLPDNSRMTVASERFRAPEMLFRPHFIGCDVAGVSTMLARSLVSVQNREELRRVVLSGGTTLLPNFGKRLRRDLPKTDILEPDHRPFSAWMGASATACLDSYRPDWIYREEYLEEGESVLRRKVGKTEWSAVGLEIRKLISGIEEDWYIDERVEFLLAFFASSGVLRIHLIGDEVRAVSYLIHAV